MKMTSNKPGLYHLLLLLVLCLGMLQLVGCSSGGTSSVAMVAGVEYAVAPGDRLVSTSATPALMEVRHDYETDIRYVTLLEGSADLLYGNYTLN